MKKIFFLVLFLLCLFSNKIDSFANDAPRIFLNNKIVAQNENIIFENSTIYIESNHMSKLFGATYSSDEDNTVLTFSNALINATYDTDTGSVNINDRNSFLHKSYVRLYPCIKKGDLIYVPLRMITTSFGIDVFFNSETFSVHLKNAYDAKSLPNSLGISIVSRNGKYGIADAENNLVSKITYDSITNFDLDTLYRVTINHRCGLIDSSANVVAEPIFNEIEYVSPNEIYLISDNLKGMCDIHGHIIIPVEYDDIAYCSNKYAMVKIGDFWFVLDCITNEITNNTRFDEVYEITNGVQTTNQFIKGFYVVKNSKWGMVDTFGNVVIDIKYDALDKFDINARARMIYKGKFGIIDSGGNIVIEPLYDYIYPFNKLNVTVATVGNKYGILDVNNKFVTKFEYDYIYPFNDQFSTVAYKNSKFGIISNTGEVITDFKYSYMEELKNGITLVYDNGYGYIDSNGNEIIKCVHSDIKQGTANSVFLKKDGLWALYLPSGRMLTDYVFVSAGDFSNGLSCVSVNTPYGIKYGYVNDSGDIIIDFIYDNAFDFRYGKAVVSKNGYTGIIDVDSNVVIAFMYKAIITQYDYNLIICCNEKGKWGLVNLSNQNISEFKYDYIEEFKNGYSVVSNNNGYGIIDTTGTEVVKPIYDKKELAYDKIDNIIKK